MEINIRKATIDDYAALCEIFNEIDALHRKHLPQLFQKPDGAARDKDYFLEQIADENIALLVADTGGELVGFVHAMLKEPPALTFFVPRSYVSVESLVVKTEFQHHSIGKMLMNEMQTWAISKGVTSIELNVYEFNQTAISFYESLGYQTVSRKMSKRT